MQKTIPARLLPLWLAAAAFSPAGVSAQDGASGQPAVQISGETRWRLEGLDNQFRANGSGGDQLLAIRTLVKAQADLDRVELVVELQDSRGYFSGDQTPLSSSLINPLDILQAYAGLRLPGLLGENSRSTLRIGRQTVSIGSKRQIERPDFANVIKSYSGAYFLAESAGGDEFHALLVVPLDRRPGERERIDRNALEMDSEEWNRRIWGAHLRLSDALPGLAPGLWAEAYVYGLSESDSEERPTPNRHYATPGFRIHRAPQPGRLDLDLEGAYRFGTRRATSAASDIADLDVSATMLFAKLGYTFDGPWQPNLALQFYHASGDGDPTDGEYGQYERLFGSRRSDLNNTSIHGPLTPANLNAAGARLELQPASNLDARLTYSAAFLDSARDSWVVAGLQDPTGQSGRFVGHALDSRLRYDVMPGTLGLELGVSALIYGEFARRVAGGPSGDAALYGYTQLTFRF